MDTDISNIVFIKKDIKLQSTVNFSQYLFKSKKLITLIGEIHNYCFYCGDKEQLSITEYSSIVVNKNSNSRILLEIQKNFPPHATESIHIVDIMNKFKKEGKEENLIMFDFRYFFLGDYLHYVYIPEYYKKLNAEQIKKHLIEPVYTKWRAGFSLDHSLYDEDCVRYLEQVYKKDIDVSFKHIFAEIDRNNMEDVQQMLMDSWMKVADFYVLREVMKNDHINEYVIIIGDTHRNNLQGIFTNMGMFGQLTKQQQGRPNNCVSLFETYQF